MPSNSGSPTPSHPLRMQQGQEQPKRYQFFPRETQLPVLNSNKALDPEKAYAFAMAQKVNRSERQAGSTGQRSGASSSMSMRRRKPSMPDIEPSPNFIDIDKPMDSRMYITIFILSLVLMECQPQSPGGRRCMRGRIARLEATERSLSRGSHGFITNWKVMKVPPREPSLSRRSVQFQIVGERHQNALPP